MTKSKLSASPTVISSIFVIDLVNGPQLLNATCVWKAPLAVILPVTKV